MHVRAVTHLKTERKENPEHTHTRNNINDYNWLHRSGDWMWCQYDMHTVNTIYTNRPFDRSFFDLFKWLNGHWIIFTNIFLFRHLFFPLDVFWSISFLLIWIQLHNKRWQNMRKQPDSYFDLCKYWRSFVWHLLDPMSVVHVLSVLASSERKSNVSHNANESYIRKWDQDARDERQIDGIVVNSIWFE